MPEGQPSTTVLPLESRHVCGVKLNFHIHNYGRKMMVLFILSVVMVAGSDHKFHCKPNVGDLPALKCHTSLATQKLMQDGKRASTGSSAL
jgi:hypothetical protein